MMKPWTLVTRFIKRAVDDPDQLHWAPNAFEKSALDMALTRLLGRVERLMAELERDLGLLHANRSTSAPIAVDDILRLESVQRLDKLDRNYVSALVIAFACLGLDSHHTWNFP